MEQILRMPSVLVRKGAFVDLTVTDAITNREVEQQQWLLQIPNYRIGAHNKIVTPLLAHLPAAVLQASFVRSS